MKREADARRLLHSLLDRLERNPNGGRRIIARAALSFASAADHRQLNDVLLAAREAGAVEVKFDREAPHLIDQVILADPARLYGYLDRESARIGRAAAATALAAASPSTDVGMELAVYFAERWIAGKSALALSPRDLDEALQLVRAADAAFTEMPGDRTPLRTRSARLLNDSKALERALPKLLSFLRESGRLDPDMEREDALRLLGLEKFPQPLLLAGPLRVAELNVADWTYVGLPPEAYGTLGLEGQARSILTIENLESFNRHVRECRQSKDVILYTGGFPAPGVVSVLQQIIAISQLDHIWHWGDIDVGGLRISRYLERVLSVPVLPHLMTKELADTFGTAAQALKKVRDVPPDSAFAPLAQYLSTPGAMWLEQEVLDPQLVEASDPWDRR